MVKADGGLVAPWSNRWRQWGVAVVLVAEQRLAARENKNREEGVEE